MSLAEELLADLEDYDNVDADAIANGGVSAATHGSVGAALDRCIAAPGDIDEIDEISEQNNLDSGQMYQRIGEVARLRDSEHFKQIMDKIQDSIDEQMEVVEDEKQSHSEADPEYQLIVEANNLAVEIDNEINVIHKFIRDKYAKRFPELESLVPMPLEYIGCVKELGNKILEKAKNSEALQKILLPATVIVVSVTASTTQGEVLTDEELERVEEACDMAEELNGAKIRIYHFVETRMARVAPNLCAVVGAATAAKLMGVAGGLSQLAKMPACNLLVLGAQKSALSGFSSTAILPHTGFVYYTSLVQSLQPDLRKKGARQLAAKCSLAVRVDACRESRQGSIGMKLANDVTQKFDKWQEPPPVKQVKALPKPLDQASKKRGGRRVRKMKERLGITDLRSKANRTTFGDIQEDVFQDNLGVTVGQMKYGGPVKPGGRIRAAQVDQKSRVRMSQKLQRNLQRQNAMASAGGSTAASSAGTSVMTSGGSTTISSRRAFVAGTSSTVTFTPVQGLEISNPGLLQEKVMRDVAAANAKYFGSTAGFLKVQSTSATPASGTASTIKDLKANVKKR